jgi:hypothetical protein
VIWSKYAVKSGEVKPGRKDHASESLQVSHKGPLTWWIVEVSGPSGLRSVKGFHDEDRKGEWAGYRSSRLGIKCRVIYCVKNQELEVYVIDVNPHKY